MARIVFIHGAWQGAWCWRDVVHMLEARGHEAVAIDLPGHGDDSSPLESVTLRDYVDRVIEAVQASKDNPILVGHSMGGVISQTAELIPDRIRALVYVAALLPPNGTPMMGFVEGFDPAYLAQFEWAPNGRTARIRPEGVRLFLYSHCPSAAIESALPLLTAQPVAPFETPVSLTEANFGRVPRYYIECLQDRVVPLALQRSMRAGLPMQHVYSLDTGHAPYSSTPEDLSLILHTIAERA